MSRVFANDFQYTTRRFSFPVAASGTESIFQPSAPASILIEPGVGGTMTCKARLYPGGTLIEVDPDNLTYSDAAIVTLNSPVYEIVFGATTAAGRGTIACL